MVSRHHFPVCFLNLCLCYTFSHTKDECSLSPGHDRLEASFIKPTHSGHYRPRFEGLPCLYAVLSSQGSSCNCQPCYQGRCHDTPSKKREEIGNLSLRGTRRGASTRTRASANNRSAHCLYNGGEAFLTLTRKFLVLF
eukprot:c40066_g1_i1 orf=2-412(-)